MDVAWITIGLAWKREIIVDYIVALIRDHGRMPNEKGFSVSPKISHNCENRSGHLVIMPVLTMAWAQESFSFEINS